ncbi:helix-turn-helix domain-containing protein, partial [Streptomyces sp. NPDC059868]|uniref:helix-turn-helix domain-containing protein n=1 Tax=Streptomyces sp. NPDC059868 TaxID=3346979 RepID=UPI003647DEFC
MLTQPSFGRRLKQLRQQRGKTQSDLTGPGMSSAYLSRLESGARPPTERAVAILAERLGVPTGAFEATDPSDLVDVLAAVLVAGDESGHARRMLESALSRAEHVDVGGGGGGPPPPPPPPTPPPPPPPPPRGKKKQNHPHPHPPLR